jgi:cobalt-precorrin 5A hydrolase/precorrin-3B C17-methyltransferase
VLALALTETGMKLARSIGLEARLLKPTTVLATLWREYEVFVIIAAVPIAVRLIAPLLSDKATDPGVVCLDEYGLYAVPLVGVHHGANHVATMVAKLTGGTPIITTPSDLAQVGSLDLIASMKLRGSIAHVQRHIGEGGSVRLTQELPWPLPHSIPIGESSYQLILSDRLLSNEELTHSTVQLIPPSLVVGVGTSSDCSPEELKELLSKTMVKNNLDETAISCIATIDRRHDHPAIQSLNLPVRSFSSDHLCEIDVPHPSEIVEQAVGTPSVCEAAALLGTDNKGELIVTKERSLNATVAIARRAAPGGTLVVVGIGPGSPIQRTREAEAAIANADVVVGFSNYLALCDDLMHHGQLALSFPIGQETERVDRALIEAGEGRRVALVCSGDPGVYAMASLVFQRREERDPSDVEIVVIPGVTAALAASAQVGAMLGHDHAYLSLSDLLTPWPVIRARVEALAPTDMVMALYNPRSRGRQAQLDETIEILTQHRPQSTVVAVARRVSRPGSSLTLTTLGEFDPTIVDMETVILIGSSTTVLLDGRAYTPRGYHQSQELSSRSHKDSGTTL